MLLMLGLLVSLVVIYQRLGIGTGKTSLNERWLVDMPFSIYLGWISVATIANASVVLLHLNWDGFGLSETTWTVIMLVVGVISGLFMTFKRSEVFYTLVLIWAFIGIAQNGSGDNVVSITAWAGSAILAILLVIARSVLRRKQLIARYKRS
jgi:hypothetical protein